MNTSIFKPVDCKEGRPIIVTTIGCWGAYPNANEATTGFLLPYFGDHRRLVQQAREKYKGHVELATFGKVWEI